MTKPNVLFVIPSLSRAGAETQLVDLVNGLSAEQFSRHLFTFQPRLDQIDRLDPKINHIHRLRRYKFDFSMIREIAKVIDNEKINVVHCTLQFALLIGWLGIRRAHRKPQLCVAIHTTLNRDFKNEALDWVLYQWLMRSCSRTVFVCESQRRHWEKKFPFLSSRSAVVYNGVDAGHFDPSKFNESGFLFRANLGIPPDAPVACCIARFLPEKGHRLLVQALPEITRSSPDAHFLLAGDGPLRPEIETALSEAGLESRVHFLGLIDDVRPVLAASNLTIMPSYTETFSMTMLESLAMGVPIVATDLGGTGEAVIPGQTGYLVEPRNPQAFSDSVLRAFDAIMSGSNQLGQNGRHLVIQNFSKQAMVDQTKSLLVELGSLDAVHGRTP